MKFTNHRRKPLPKLLTAGATAVLVAATLACVGCSTSSQITIGQAGNEDVTFEATNGTGQAITSVSVKSAWLNSWDDTLAQDGEWKADEKATITIDQDFIKLPEVSLDDAGYDFNTLAEAAETDARATSMGVETSSDATTTDATSAGATTESTDATSAGATTESTDATSTDVSTESTDATSADVSTDAATTDSSIDGVSVTETTSGDIDLTFEPLADIKFTTADGMSYELHQLNLKDIKDATFKLDGGVAYLEYTSIETGAAVNTLEAEKEYEIMVKEAAEVQSKQQEAIDTAVKEEAEKKLAEEEAAKKEADQAEEKAASDTSNTDSSSSDSSASESEKSSKSEKSSSDKSEKSSKSEKSKKSSDSSKSDSSSSKKSDSGSSSSSDKSSSDADNASSDEDVCVDDLVLNE
jgi:hypothetical protein